jgi:putative ABC transport system substrate-binding protein
MSGIGRREFVALIGGVATAAWPLAARAQQAERMRRVGVLKSTTEDDSEGRARDAAFLKGLRDVGLTEGRNVKLDYRWAGSDVKRLRVFASELVALAPDELLAGSSPSLAALHRATATVPIVFVLVSDPVGQGFVQSLAHPGSNITGFSNFEFSTIGKWVDLLNGIAPDVKHTALIFNPDTAPYARHYLPAFEDGAKSFAAEPISAPVHSETELESATGALAERGGGGIIVMPDPFTLTHRGAIISLAARYRLPAVYPFRYFASDGGLISYGPDFIDQYRRAAGYVDRILKGEKPADLPVQAPTKYELVINLRTAKALGLEIPPTLLALADEVIE